MANIVNLKIENFRGIKSFEKCFDSKFVCLIGRGDTCKSTILEAISAVLSPAWNLSFVDTDFFGCNIDNEIKIEVSLINLPEELLTEGKFGLSLRYYNDGQLFDEIPEEMEGNALTITLIIDKTLEPKWSVRNYRTNDEKSISANDRSKLNCFFVSDYADKHFSLGKGNLLYSLLKLSNSEPNDGAIVDILRSAKKSIDSSQSENLNDLIKEIEYKASTLGINVKDSSASIDSSDIIFKNGKLCLHDSEKIPYRLKGKGTKRLLSIAIQLSLLEKGGILLIDEIEVGLEPDRIRHIANILKDYSNINGQVFLTTHSRDVIVELSSKDLYVTKKDKSSYLNLYKLCDNNNIQSTVRTCPDAFFAKKIIICEGKTEIGICRSIEKYAMNVLNKESFSYHDTSTLFGDGADLINKTKKLIELKAFEKLSVFMDSDDDEQNKEKAALKDNGVVIIDCNKGLKIESQVFNDLPLTAIKDLVAKCIEMECTSEASIIDFFKTKGISFEIEKIEEAYREHFIELSTKKKSSWFKRIDHGEALGDIVLKYDTELQGKYLKTITDGIIRFIYD